MPPRRSSVQRSPPKRDHAVRVLRRSPAGASSTIGPADADISRSNSARFERGPPTKVVVPVRLVRSNTSANHSTSRRRVMLTPPRKVHPSESRYSNQSWKERRQEVEVEELSSVTTPVEPIATRTSLVGALAQSARSSSNKSVLALVQAATATVTAITTSAPLSISKDKEEASSSPLSPVVRNPQHQPAPSLPLSWRRALQSLLVAADALCIAANSVRLWTLLLAPSTAIFQAVLPASAFATTSAERVMGGALWEVGFAVFHGVSILRLLLSGSGLLRRSNRVVPLSALETTSASIQWIKIPSQSFGSIAVGVQDRAIAEGRGIDVRDLVKVPSLDWLWKVLHLRVGLMAYGNVDDEGQATNSWTHGSSVLLLTNWILQLCTAAGMSSALPTLPSTPHEFYVTVILLNMWALPALYCIIRRFRSRRLRVEVDHFFHIVWIASSLTITIIGLAVVPLAVFHHQCRGSFNASEHRFDGSKQLDPVWMGSASLAMEWLVTTSVCPAALRVIAGLCGVVTVESINTALVEDAARAQRTQALSQQPRLHSNALSASAHHKTSLTRSIPDLLSVKTPTCGSKWLASWKAVQKAASPLRLACALALTLGIIAIAGHSSSVRSVSLPDAITTLDDLVPPALPASQLKFISIRDCPRLEMTLLLAEMSSLVALTLSNTSVSSWASPFSHLSHPNLRSVTLADATIAAPFLDAQLPPEWLGELLLCGESSEFPSVTDAQRMRMPHLEETHINSC